MGTLGRIDKLDALLRPYGENSPWNQGLIRPWPESRWQWLPHANVWLKREDELGFPCNGPKVRKLVSVCQTLQTAKPRRLVSWGSSRSAFLFGLVQISKSLGIPAELHLIRSTEWSDQGVDALYRCLLESETIHWVERNELATLAERLAKNLEEGDFYVPEGGVMPASLPGALSLPLEIAAQEQRLGIELESVWIDAGSGFSAQALILGLGFLERKTKVQVVLCAGDEASFEAGLKARKAEAEKLWPEDRWNLADWTLHRPSTARSYGATNRQVWDAMQNVLSREGLLLDPLYNAKLFLTFAAKRTTESQNAATLLVHSGGALSSLAYPGAFRALKKTKGDH